MENEQSKNVVNPLSRVEWIPILPRGSIIIKDDLYTCGVIFGYDITSATHSYSPSCFNFRYSVDR